MFDINAAIAGLASRGFGYSDRSYNPTMELAIERCPELAEPLRRITDVLEDVETYGNPADLVSEKRDAQHEQEQLYALVEEAEARFAQIRDMAITLAKMDSAKAVKPLIDTLVSKADDAQVYLQKRKVA